MASDVQICNLALAHLGDTANISALDEGSSQSEHCTRFYPIALDALLEMHTWSFATKRASLALFDVESYAWEFAYALPSDCVRVISVLENESTDDDAVQPYEIETTADGQDVLYTNVENAVIRYVSKVTDSGRFTPLFVDCLSRLLASYLAGPIIKGDSGVKMAQAMYGAFLRSLGFAASSDANQRKDDDTYEASWIGAR